MEVVGIEKLWNLVVDNIFICIRLVPQTNNLHLVSTVETRGG